MVTTQDTKTKMKIAEANKSKNSEMHCLRCKKITHHHRCIVTEKTVGKGVWVCMNCGKTRR